MLLVSSWLKHKDTKHTKKRMKLILEKQKNFVFLVSSHERRGGWLKHKHEAHEEKNETYFRETKNLCAPCVLVVNK